MLRFSGGTARPTAPRITENEVPDRPRPISSPALRVSVAGHQRQPHRIENAADEHGTCDAEAIGQRTGHRLHQPPDQVLHGNGEGEHFPPPAELSTHRRQEQAEAVPHPEGNGEDQRTTGEYPGSIAPCSSHRNVPC